MSEDPQQTLGLLIEHELAVGRLYLACASVFAQVRDFWRSLAGDEQRHADLLSGLADDPALGLWLAGDSGVRPQAIRSSLAYLQDQTAKVHEGRSTLLQALAVANDVENALIDRRWVLPTAPECAAIGRVLADLKSQTEAHRSRIADALEIEKRLHSQPHV